MSRFSEIQALDKQYFMNTYSPYDIAFVRGDGCRLWDSEGKEYIDFLAGIAVTCLGHNNPIFTKAVAEHAAKLTVCSNYFYSEERAAAAELLVRGTALQKVFFANSGAEANECAIKLVRRYMGAQGNGRYKIVSALDSFHGRTLATVTATGQTKYNKPFAPLPQGIGIYVPYNDVEALRTALADPEVAALLIEPIQGEGGVTPATQEYMTAAREITRANGQLLVLDEVQTGAMRTGKFWAYEHYGIQPDILTSAKGIGGGFPIGACLATDEVASAWHSGDHGTTFGAAPMACGVATAVMTELRRPEFVQSVIAQGEYLRTKLTALLGDKIVDVRGIGLMLGAELAPEISAKAVCLEMLSRGFVVCACGKNTLRFVPPLVIAKSDIDRMTIALSETLAAM